MTRRSYQVSFLLLISFFTLLFFKEIKSAGTLFPHVDKVAHFAAFFCLAWLMDKGFRWPLTWQIGLLACYGVGIELVQHMLPYRQASFWDFIADLAGSLAYFVLAFYAHKRSQTAPDIDENESDNA